MNHIELLNHIIGVKGFTKYLEIGTAKCICFDQIKCKHKVGVDPADETHMRPDAGQVYGVTSDEFFPQNSQTFQLVYIDGLHLYEQVAKDIVNAYNCLEVGGFIVLHDCFPPGEEWSRRAPLTPQSGWNGDCYKAILWFRSTYPEILCNVIDADYGMGFIHKTEQGLLKPGCENLLSYMDLDYDWLIRNIEQLGVVEVSWVLDYLKKEK